MSLTLLTSCTRADATSGHGPWQRAVRSLSASWTARLPCCRCAAWLATGVEPGKRCRHVASLSVKLQRFVRCSSPRKVAIEFGRVTGTPAARSGADQGAVSQRPCILARVDAANEARGILTEADHEQA
jgi:hypothetical protein